MDKRICGPQLSGPFRRVYPPGPDIYTGIPTQSFCPGDMYVQWIPNDFTFIKGRDGVWHALGITHPRPPCFIDDFNCDGDMHEAEYQLFHCTFDGDLKTLYESGRMEEAPKVLTSGERPGERPEIWAPCVVEREGLYYMVYSPGAMRLAVSEDLYHWTPRGVLFEGGDMARDPYIIEENGTYTMIYTDDHLYYRTSRDMMTWSGEKLFQRNPFPHTAQESPCVIKHDGKCYLIWCLCDGRNGSYDNRTFVYAADNLSGFSDIPPTGMLPGHGPEIVEEDGRHYFISVFYPEIGLNMAPINWLPI